MAFTALTGILIKGVAASAAITAAQTLILRRWNHELSSLPGEITEAVVSAEAQLGNASAGSSQVTSSPWLRAALPAARAVATAMSFRALALTSAHFMATWAVWSSVMPFVRFVPPLRWVVGQHTTSLLKNLAFTGAGYVVLRRALSAAKRLESTLNTVSVAAAPPATTADAHA